MYTYKESKRNMALRVVAAAASNLPNVEKIGKSDPYCILSLYGKSGMCELHIIISQFLVEYFF